MGVSNRGTVYSHPGCSGQKLNQHADAEHRGVGCGTQHLSFIRVCVVLKIHFLKKFYFENQTHRRGFTDLHRNLFICWFTPQMPTMARAQSGQSQELLPDILQGWQEPNTWAIFHCFPQANSSELVY